MVQRVMFTAVQDRRTLLTISQEKFCMSAETDSDTNTIYVELLDEGTFVIRPTQAQFISETSNLKPQT